MLNEFKEFAMRGNVLDLAVGFIMGGAFSTIVSSFVNDIIMPPIGILLGGVDFSSLGWQLKAAEVAADGTVTDAVSINYGVFINAIISFVIVAFALFMVIKAMNSMQKQEEEAEEAPAEPPRQEVLLEEIRDALRSNS